jgi:hypothetical protein
MTEKKSLVEEAILQMKNLEEAVAENAKGILASTMRQEIKDLVKESLKEEDDEIEGDDEMEDENEMEMEDEDEMDMDDMDMEDEDEMDMEDEDEMDMSEPDMEVDTIDLTDQPTSQVLKVFKLLSPEDEIIVTKDKSGNINLKDSETDKEYMIVGESDMDFTSMEEEDEDYGMYDEAMVGYDTMEEYEMSEEMDDYSLEEEEDEFEDFGMEETIYEVEMEDGMDLSMEDEDEMDMEDMDIEYELEMDDDSDYMMESKKSMKPKGMDFGDAKSYKISGKPNMEGGFKVVKTNADTTMGTGSAKSFKYGKGENLDGEFKIKPKMKKAESKEGMMKMPKKMETKEASRTYGNGSKSGRGLRKGITPNRNLTFESTESKELNLLREKNEEYRKALNIFRNKLNEVAIFNSNLAYATRLFTEHSTSKQEKINILKRFDGVETLKESKNLYKVIKDELSNTSTQQVNESVERSIQKTPSTGSAVNLIESKTYENPQFMRMKDLMSKLK